jgi:hypothetical protein
MDVVVTIDAKWACYVIYKNINLYYPIHSIIGVPIEIHMVMALEIASWGIFTIKVPKRIV